MKCTYRNRTYYEVLKNKAFVLVKSKALSDLSDAYFKEQLGVPTDRSSVLRYQYLINYLLYVRQQIDQRRNGCIEQEVYDKFLITYGIDCILKEGVCEKYTNNLVDLILGTIPICGKAYTYDWYGAGNCIEINDESYRERDILQTLSNNVVIDADYIPSQATANDLVTLLGITLTDAQSLIDTRLVEGINCCLEGLLPNVVTLEVEATASTATVSWSSTATIFQVSLAKGSVDNIVSTTTLTTPSVSYTGLDLSTAYFVIVVIENCAGVTQTVIPFNTLPYIINIIVQTAVTLTDAVEGYNFFSTYGGTFEFRFDNITITPSPNIIVSSVLVNGTEYINNVLFDSYFGGSGIGGVISLPYVTGDNEIIIIGTSLDICATFSAVFDEDIDTITINLV